MKRIKKGDDVIIIAGKDKGQRGSVLEILNGGQKVTVEGVNQVKKHVKANPQKNTDGGITDKEAPIHVSNVAIYNPVTEKKDRIGFCFLEDGRKVRYYKSNGELLDV